MSESEEDIEIYKCANCEINFSNEIVAQIKQNNSKLYCEYCGKKIKVRDYVSRLTTATNNADVLWLDRDPENPIVKETTNLQVSEDAEEEEKTPEELLTKEGIIQQFNVFVVRRAYEVLKEFQYDIEMEKDQKEPDSYQLNELAGILRNKITHLLFEEDWLADLSPANQKAFSSYSKFFTKFLKNKKFYREHYMEFFQEAILTVYRLIKGLPDESIEEQKRLEILMDLKNAFGFALYLNARDTFEFQLTAFVASEIYYSKTFRESVLQCDDSSGEIDRAVGKFALELFRSFDQQKFLYKYADTLKWKYKVKFKIKLNNLRDETKEDHVFCESFMDYLKWLTRTVLELVCGTDYSKLDNMKRDILEYLLRTLPFLSDRELQSSFVTNFKIVLCRMMSFEWSKKIRAQKTEGRERAFEDELLVKVSPEKIGREFLSDLREISLDDFERNYGKFQLKMKRDHIYRAGFNQFVHSLFNAICKLIRGNYDPKTLSKSELLINQDLQKFKQTLAVKGELTPIKPDLLSDKKNHVTMEENKALLTRATELPDIEDIFIVASDSKKHPITAVIDTGASIRESLLDLALATRLGLDIDFNTQKWISISGAELKGHPCKATIVFRNTPMTIEFLAIDKLQKTILDYSGLVSFPALISKPILLKYSELTGQDGKIVLDLKDQSTNVNNISILDVHKNENSNFSIEANNAELLVLKTIKSKKSKKALLTQRIQIKYLKQLSEICQLSKKLRNSAVFIGRQAYFLINPPPYVCKHKIPLAKKYPEFAKKLLEFMENKVDSPSLFAELKKIALIDPTVKISDELIRKLMGLWKQAWLYEWLKFESVFTNLGKVYSQLPTQTLLKVQDSWRSYFESVKEWRKNPSLFPGGERPNIPHYGRKSNEFLILFSGHHIKNLKGIRKHYENTKRTTIIHHRKTKKLLKSYTTAELLLPNTFLKKFTERPFPKIRTTIDLEKISEVRIVPKGDCFIIEIAYSTPEKEKGVLDPNKVASIDKGLNNLMTITTNVYLDGRKLPPIIIRGYYAKWANQLMNKKISTLQSNRLRGATLNKGLLIPETPEMRRIRQKRQNRIRNYFHYCSCFLIEFCKYFGIETVYIGHNNYWKSEINIGKKNTQNFTFVPFNWLVNQIKYKAKMMGINILVKNESFTSKASAIDGDFIPDYDPNNMYNGAFSGSRAPSMQGKKSKKEIEEERQSTGIFEIDENKLYNPRGLYKTKSGYYIHSDVDGSYNIGRKHAPNAFDMLTIRDMLVSPITVNLLKNSTRCELNRLVSRIKSGSIAAV